MSRTAYIDRQFAASSLDLIETANGICAEYAADGYSLTLRQLYYQFVARGHLPNRDSEYKRLGSIVNDARLAGLIDWDYIVDRTRQLHRVPQWGSAFDTGSDAAHTFVRSVMPQFKTRRWDSQPARVEAWIEKDALIDVISRPANDLYLPFFASRGYNSQSNAHEAAERIEGYFDAGAERVVILHLGDHDPEGIDMSRDIEARFKQFLAGDGYEQHAEYDFEVRRVALNMDQVERYNPPPNPAKPTSSRYIGYVAQHGRTCWELDALDPPTIDALIRAEVEAELDRPAWQEAIEREEAGKALLTKAVERWGDVVALLEPDSGNGAHS